jgi:hypothetical protein
MDPLTASLIGQTAGAGVGALIGDGGQDEREKLLAYLQGLDVSAGDSAFGNLANDQLLTDRQIQALELLRSNFDQGGMDAQAKAALGQSMQTTGQQETGQRGAIVQNSQMRGVGGSGVDLAAQLANQQGAAQRNAVAGSNFAGAAAQRGLESLKGSAAIAGDVRGQEMTKGSALDRFNMAEADRRLQKAGLMAGASGNAANGQDAERQKETNALAGLGTAIGGVSTLLGKKKPEDDLLGPVSMPEEIR